MRRPLFPVTCLALACLALGSLAVVEPRSAMAEEPPHNGADEVAAPVLASEVRQATPTLRDAIERGAPLFNEGDPAACAEIYEKAARGLLAGDGPPIADLVRARLRAVADAPSVGATERAWAWREAFDEILLDEAFAPRIEAAMPPGFPAPGPVGRVVSKTYPRYRAARAAGGNGFWTLFQHIQRNDVAMTAPVEMTLDGDLRELSMAFLYEQPGQESTGTQGAVEVVDEAAQVVMSIGMRGPRTSAAIATAKRLVEAQLAKQAVRASGRWRVLGYNSPMVPRSKRYWELQVPITR